jgi:hypothetical protein
MQEQTKPCEFDDVDVQQAVLSLALAVYPMHCLAIPAITRRVRCGDATKRAVRVLESVGLLEEVQGCFRPSAAALHLEQMEMAQARSGVE